MRNQPPNKPREIVPTSATTEDKLRELGKLLAAAREALNIKPRELANLVDISETYVRVLEKGFNSRTGKPSRPSVNLLLQLCQVLELDSDEVLPLAGVRATRAQSEEVERIGAARGATSDALNRIQKAAAGISDRGPFLAEQMQIRLRQFATEFGRVSQGTLKCIPAEEPRLSRAAAKNCTAHMRAVSYQDDSWWRGSDGDAYLDLHKELRDRDVDITRIFLFEDDAPLTDFKDAFHRHHELGIETYVLRLSDVPDYLHSDFVVYDNELVRRAQSDDFDGGGKIAEFSDDQLNVDQALLEFHDILAIAESRRDAALEVIVGGLKGNS